MDRLCILWISLLFLHIWLTRICGYGSSINIEDKQKNVPFYSKKKSNTPSHKRWRVVVKQRGPHPKQDFDMWEKGLNMTEADVVKEILRMGYMPQDIQLLEPSLE